MKSILGSRLALSVVALLGIGVLAMQCSAGEFVTVRDAKFIDIEGRQVLLHGINVINKNKAEGYVPWQTREDFARLRDWGMNCVRLGILWDGIEPEPGHYDEAYLKQIDARVQWAGDAGLYVMLDMHQDLFSVLYSDGAPEWATLTDGKPHTHGEGVWSDAYFTSPAVQAAFDNFWANTPGPDGVGIQDRFALAWQVVAKRYADNPAVLGYDLFNEPNPGSKSPEAQMAMVVAFARLLRDKVGEQAPSELEIISQWMKPDGRAALMRYLDDTDMYTKVIDAVEPIYAAFETSQLMPMYQRVAEAIRAVDANHILFLETSMAANMGVRSAIEPVVGRDGQRDPRQAYAPHGYDLVVDTPYQTQASHDRIALIFQRHAETATRLGMPTLVGEWGAYGGANADILPAAWAVVRQFEKHLASETYWEYGHYAVDAAYKDVLARPLPLEVAGTLVSYKRDETGVFTCVWHEDPDVTAPTRVFLPGDYDRQHLEVTPAAADVHVDVMDSTSNTAFVLIPPTGERGERRLTVSMK